MMSFPGKREICPTPGPAFLFTSSARSKFSCAWFILLAACTVGLASATDVVTYHNDNHRTGQNSQETILALSNVNSGSFGKLFTLPVDGVIDAEPLYLSVGSIDFWPGHAQCAVCGH